MGEFRGESPKEGNCHEYNVDRTLSSQTFKRGICGTAPILLVARGCFANERKIRWRFIPRPESKLLIDHEVLVSLYQRDEKRRQTAPRDQPRNIIARNVR